MPGLHLILDAEAAAGLHDRRAVEDFIRRAAELAGMTIIGLQSHLLPTDLDSGPGVTAVAVIAESHIAVHTWPEHGVVTADVYSCREFEPEVITGLFVGWFQVERWLVRERVQRFGRAQQIAGVRR